LNGALALIASKKPTPLIPMNKPATPGYPINELMRERWSPRAFLDKAVEPGKLLAIMEAARWAPSSFNEQPWTFFIARKEETEEFEKMLGCLVEANRAWAKGAPVLLISVVKKSFTQGGKPNRVAIHDVGLASENMTLQAVELGLLTHGMAGIEQEKVRDVYNLPEDYEAVAAWAIGYDGDPALLQGKLREMEEAPRTRKALKEFVFGGKFGKPAAILG
jgi:nitroreductase